MVARISRAVLPLAFALALAACGGKAEPTLDAAQSAFASEDYAAARATLIALGAVTPSDPAALRLLAQTQLRLGDGEAAQATIGRLKGLEIKDIGLLEAEALSLRGLHGEALTMLDGHSGVEAERIRAAALLGKGDPLAAIKAFAAARAAGGNYDAWLAWAEFCMAASDLDEAEAAAAKARALRPQGLRVQLLAARLLALRGQTDAALATYSKAAEQHPFSAAPLVGAAEQFEQTGKLDRAAAALARAEEISPDDPAIGAIQIRIAAAQGKWAEVRQGLQSVERDADAVTPERLLYAEALLRLGNVEQARVIYNAALTLQPDNTYVRQMLADARLQGGDADGALATLQPMLDEPALDPAALDLAITAAQAVGDPLADDLRARAASEEYRAISALSAKAQTALMQSRWADVASGLEQLAAYGSDAELDRTRAYALARLGRGGQAVPLALKALAAQPDNPDAIKTAALARLAEGTAQAEAIALLKRTLDLSPHDYEAALALYRVAGSAGSDGTG